MLRRAFPTGGQACRILARFVLGVEQGAGTTPDQRGVGFAPIHPLATALLKRTMTWRIGQRCGGKHVFETLTHLCSAIASVTFFGEFRSAVRKVVDDFRTLVQFDDL